MKSILLLALAVLITTATNAFAVCSDPSGSEGEIIYNKTYQIPVFCNGTDWIAWGSGNAADTVPSGAIMAFDLASCPTGWTEYALARGRFLRGIDSTGTNDPDGVRTLGSTQDDAYKSHVHGAADGGSFLTWGGSSKNLSTTAGSAFGAAGNGATKSSGGDETRPKNVAVLYCEKD